MENNPSANPPGGQSGLTSDEKTWGLLMYLSSFVGGIILTIIFYVIKKDTSKFVAEAGKEVLNWEITFLIIFIPLYILMIAMVFVLGPIVMLFTLLIVAVAICNLVFGILGMVKANNGEIYRYPFSFKFIK